MSIISSYLGHVKKNFAWRILFIVSSHYCFTFTMEPIAENEEDLFESSIAHANLDLGKCYILGTGGEKNFLQAINVLTRASKQSSDYNVAVEAYVWLAFMAYFGWGMDSVRGIALNYLEQAFIIKVNDNLVSVGELMIGRTIDFSSRDVNGRTLLHQYAERGAAWAVQFLLFKGIEPDVTDDFGATPLIVAARKGQSKSMEVLLIAGAKVNVAEKYGETALHCAAQSPQSECTELLLAAGGDPAVRDIHKRTPLLIALKEKKFFNARALINTGIALDAADESGLSALYYAASFSSHDLTSALLSKGVSLVSPPSSGSSLVVAADSGQYETVLLLLEAGASPNTTGAGGNKPLHNASLRGCTPVVRLLLERGAEVNALNHTRETPLHRAASGGDKEVIELLCAHGADVQARDDFRATPLLSYCRPFPLRANPPPPLLAVIESLPIDECQSLLLKAAGMGHDATLERLIERGVDLNAQKPAEGVEGGAALHYAALRGQRDMVVLLVRRGADPELKNSHGQTPLHCACSENKKNIVEWLLLDAHVDVASADNEGWTPLHLAARNCDRDMVRCLVQAGAPLNVVTSLGLTPLHKAAEYTMPDCSEEVVRILLEAGADKTVRSQNGKTAYDLARTDAIKRMLE